MQDFFSKQYTLGSFEAILGRLYSPKPKEELYDWSSIFQKIPEMTVLRRELRQKNTVASRIRVLGL